MRRWGHIALRKKGFNVILTEISFNSKIGSIENYSNKHQGDIELKPRELVYSIIQPYKKHPLERHPYVKLGSSFFGSCKVLD